MTARYLGKRCGFSIVNRRPVDGVLAGDSSPHRNKKMAQVRPNWAMVVCCAVAFYLANASNAAPPQVPSLPSQMAGYVQYAITNLPDHYKNGPVAATDNTPPDNALTDAGATLGRVLFYDKRLSHTNGVSCGSCHRQANGFSDPNQFSTGVAGQTSRHSPGLSNAKYYANGKAFWDERAASLEAQALVPIENAVEMGSTLSEVIAKLNQTAYYAPLFQAAFGSAEITSDRIGKAIAQFERSMVSYQSKYDTAFSPGQPPNFGSVLTADENAGRNIFNGTGKCNACHTTDAHVSNGVHNIGLDATNTDVGVNPPGTGQFKAPSLRNVAVRGRFMHDGRFATLDEVVQFYNGDIQNNPDLDAVLQTPQQTPLRMGLNVAQRSQLVAYLNTLTDNTFLASSLFSDPFVTLPGDYTGDGVVNGADYDLWRASYGDTTSLVADGNGDLIVDAADYVVWRNNVGRTWQDLATGGGTSLASSTVPEPASCALALTYLAWGFTRRRRRA